MQKEHLDLDLKGECSRELGKECTGKCLTTDTPPSQKSPDCIIAMC